MRGFVGALLALLLVDAALVSGLRRLFAERDTLQSASAEIDARAERIRAAAEHERELEVVVDRARASMPRGELDIGTLRDLLIGAERGLDVDRISLDFRPDSDLKRSRGGRVEATLIGPFAALYDYLGRVEALHLPLSVEDLSLREGPPGRLLLTIRWSVLWALSAGGAKEESTALSADDLTELNAWLLQKPSPRPARDLFSGTEKPIESRSVTPVRKAPVSGERSASSEPEPTPPRSTPQLSGFVLARPELERDVSRRVLAALRYQGELRLVKVGDLVGDFRVERIDARESVLLVHEPTGERVVLRLE